MAEDDGKKWTATYELRKTLLNVAGNSTKSTGSERMRAALALCALEGESVPSDVVRILAWEKSTA